MSLAMEQPRHGRQKAPQRPDSEGGEATLAKRSGLRKLSQTRRLEVFPPKEAYKLSSRRSRSTGRSGSPTAGTFRVGW